MEKLYNIYETLLNRNIINIYHVSHEIFIIADDVETAYYLLHTSEIQMSHITIQNINNPFVKKIIELLVKSNWTLEEIVLGKIIRLDITDLFENMTI